MLNRSIWKHIGLTLLATAIFVAPAWAQVESATVAVNGMSCPFCAYGIEKRLKKVEGVRSVNISTKQGTARLVAKDQESIAVDQIPGAVKKAGFTAGGITVEVVGVITTDEQDRVALRVRGADQTFLLTTFDTKEEEELRSLAEKGASVRVEGPLHDHVDELSAINPHKVEKIPA